MNLRERKERSSVNTEIGSFRLESLADVRDEQHPEAPPRSREWEY